MDDRGSPSEAEIEHYERVKKKFARSQARRELRQKLASRRPKVRSLVTLFRKRRAHRSKGMESRGAPAMVVEDSDAAVTDAEVETSSSEESNQGIQVPHARRNVQVIMSDGTVVVRVRECAGSSPPLNLTNSLPSPCEGCLKAGATCMVPKSGREKICTTCKRKKKKCSIKGVVNRLVATGELGSIEESTNFKISKKEDIIELGLERGSELILLQLFSLQQRLDDKLASIEKRLGAMEKGKARAGDQVDDDGSDSSGGSSVTYEDWSGWDQ